MLKDPRPINLYAVYVQEVNHHLISGEDPIEWMLLTDLITTDFETALTRIKWYKYRWQIELFHKIIKSGYRVEYCRLSQAKRLVRYLTVISIIAFRILFMTFLRKHEKSVKADSVFTRDELAILLMWSNRINKKTSSSLSFFDAIRILAQKGGFFCRKSDGNPGFLTIWRGLKKLSEYVESYRMLVSLDKRCGYF